MATTWSEVTPTVAADAHATGEHVGGIMSFTTPSATSWVVAKAILTCTTNITPQIELLMFAATPTSPGADSAAFTYADTTKGRGQIFLPTATVVAALGAYAYWSGYELVETDATTLFVIAVNRGASFTPAADGLTFRLGIVPAP
jgi:hypothetical protein